MSDEERSDAPQAHADAWRVRLRGDEHELRLAAAQFTTAGCAVTIDGTDAYLVSEDFTSMAEASQVWSRATDHLIPLVNAATKRVWRGAENLKAEEVVRTYPDGTMTRTQFLPLESGTAWLSCPVLTADGRLAPDAGLSLGQILALLRHDQVVSEAARFLTDSRPWAVNLWKGYELIRNDVGGRRAIIHERRWATGDEIDGFEAAVHDPAVSGNDARHRVYDRPLPRDPMNKRRATAFMLQLFEQWVRWRYEQLGATSPADASRLSQK